MKAKSDNLLSPKTDYIFKLIFGDQRNIDILADFLKSILDLPEAEYVSLAVIDPHLKPEAEDEKSGILDVKATTATGKTIDIEIQVAPHAGFRERIVRYTGQMLAGQIKRGRKYTGMRRVINIVITDWNLLEDYDRYHHCFRLHDLSDGALFTDMIEIHTLELPKLPAASDQTPLWAWLRFLLSTRWREIIMLTKENPMILKAGNVLKELSKSARTRLIAESREKLQWDIAAGKAEKDQARLEGKLEGRLEGITEGKTELVRKTLQKLPPETVAGLLDLPLAEVKRLAADKKPAPRRNRGRKGR